MIKYIKDHIKKFIREEARQAYSWKGVNQFDDEKIIRQMAISNHNGITSLTNRINELEIQTRDTIQNLSNQFSGLYCDIRAMEEMLEESGFDDWFRTIQETK